MVKKIVHYDTRIDIKCTSGDKILIKEKAKEAGKDISDYMRTVALNKKIESKTDLHTVIQIRRIGSNINQIARKMNSTSEIKNVDELILRLKLIHQELEEMKSILKINK